MFFSRMVSVSSRFRPRGAVENHIFSGHIGNQPGKVGKGGFLSLLKILKKGSRRDDAAVIILQAKAFQRIGLKLFFQRPFAEIIIKIPVLQAVDAGPEPLFQVLDIYTAHQEGLVADNLCRRKLRDLVQKLPLVFHLRHQIVAGTDVRDGNAVLVRCADNTHNIVIFGFIQSLDAHVGTRGHNLDDFPFHQAFGQLRIFHLFADGDLVAVAHQPVQIPVHGMVGNPAHGSPLVQTAVFSCQRQLQFLGHQLGILKKHLIKVTQTIKKDTVLVLFLSPHILLHHGCHFFTLHLIYMLLKSSLLSFRFFFQSPLTSGPKHRCNFSTKHANLQETTRGKVAQIKKTERFLFTAPPVIFLILLFSQILSQFQAGPHIRHLQPPTESR